MAQPIPPRFVELIATITRAIHEKPVAGDLGDTLNTAFPADGEIVAQLTELCRTGREEGWLCAREHGGIRFGRPINAGPETHGFSVDVVEMENVVGPHHRHPNGEIDLVMPDTPGAAFDGMTEGWMVYAAGSAHSPTVAGGKSLVLYLLPEGAIEFTRG
jgi:hypothetical protein